MSFGALVYLNYRRILFLIYLLFCCPCDVFFVSACHPYRRLCFGLEMAEKEGDLGQHYQWIQSHQPQK